MDVPEFLQFKYEKELNRGAEAVILEGKFLQWDAIVKYRFPKEYRNYQIDDKLRKERTVQEVRLLQGAKTVGISVPYVYDVDKTHWGITMEKVPGEPLKDRLKDANLVSYFTQLGEIIGKMHQNEIIHGDLTTSNVFVDGDNRIWLIDFGLGYFSGELENQAVDILVLKHILESSHHEVHEGAYNAFLEGYTSSHSNAKSVLKRTKVVENRVRYKSH